MSSVLDYSQFFIKRRSNGFKTKFANFYKELSSFHYKTTIKYSVYLPSRAPDPIIYLYRPQKMISPCHYQPQASPVPESGRLSKPRLIELLSGQENIIEQQNLQISKIERQLKQVRHADKKKRERQLYELFKEKYDLQCKNRANFEKQVRGCIRQIQDKVANIDKILFRCMASDSTEISLPNDITSSIDPKFLYSSEFSNIPHNPNAILQASLDVGQVTEVDCTAILSQLSSKLEYMETVVEIVFNRLDKYALENRNVQRLINAEKRELEKQVETLKKELKGEVSEKEKLKKMLQSVKAEKFKWAERLNNEKIGEKVQKLMSLDKQKLVEEIVKTMINLQTVTKERDIKEAELATCKEQEKARYANFLLKIRERKGQIGQKTSI